MKALFRGLSNDYKILSSDGTTHRYHVSYRNTLIWTVLILYSIFTTYLLLARTTIQETIPYSIARDAIQYELHDEIPNPTSVYSGEPTMEQDKAWYELILPVHMNASATELKQLGVDPSPRVALSEGGFLATLGVYHELHCLRRLKWFIYFDEYFPNSTDVERATELEHADHCIEVMRRSVMCLGNTATQTYEWTEDGLLDPFSTDKNKCVDWDNLHKWALDRSLPLDLDFEKDLVMS